MRSAIGSLAGGGEMLVGFLEVALLESLAAEQEAGDPVRGLDLDQLLGELDGAIPMRRCRLEQEGLLENDLVGRILGERLGIEVGGGDRVMVAAGEAAGKIIAEQRAGVFGVLGGDFRVGGGRRDERGKEERAPRQFAQSRTVHNFHMASAITPPQKCGSYDPQPRLGAFRLCNKPKACLKANRGWFVAYWRDIGARLTYWRSSVPRRPPAAPR